MKYTLVYQKMHPSHILELPPIDTDSHLNMFKGLMRPTYSERPGCWQMDIMSGVDKKYLILINVNTRYLFVRQIASKSGSDIVNAFTDIINTANAMNQFDGYEFVFTHVKGDDEAGFNALKKAGYENIVFSFVNEPYSFHNKMVDSVTRTIRGALGLNPFSIDNVDNVARVVELYNNTTPFRGWDKHR